MAKSAKSIHSELSGERVEELRLSYEMFRLNALLPRQPGLGSRIDFRVEATGAARVRLVYSRGRGYGLARAVARQLVHRQGIASGMMMLDDDDVRCATRLHLYRKDSIKSLRNFKCDITNSVKTFDR